MATQFVVYPENTIGSSSIVIAKIEDTAGNPLTSTAGSLNVNVTGGTITASNPSVGVNGAAVPADSTYAGMNVAGLLTGLSGTVNGLKVDGSAVTQPVSGTGNFTVVQPTGTNLHAVVDSGSIAVSNFPGTQTVSGTVTANQGTSPWVTNISQFGGSNVVTGTGTSGAGIPRFTVSNDSNILSTQSGTWTVQPGNTANTTPWLLTINQGGNSASVTGANALKVDGSAVTQPVSGTVTANAGTGTFAVNQAGRTKVNLIRNNYDSGTGGTNVTTAAYVQLVSSTAATINQLDIFDSSGQTLVFAVGAAASEVDQFYVYPGGNGIIELAIPSGSRLSIKAISATANVGELDINTFS